MPNRLANEHSPYLLQHQDNPVDWFPWGEEAFARAKAEDKPIFLSIGYSTCHWCHVMAHESFESAAIAARLNADFVPVKLDREERPDIDRVYMTFVQATTGSGGWPMSVWLTPALQPFYGGTYFPPTSRWGRPGFLELLTEIARAWREERPRVVASAGRLFEQLQAITARGNADEAAATATGPSGERWPTLLEATVSAFREVYDASHGGFGRAPKFPRPSELLFLLREHARTGSVEARAMVVGTLRGMVRGGMHDQLGGGFHRYSVDAEWRVPHFEKMLYDQAQLLLALTEAAAVTGDGEFREAASGILSYVERDLTGAGGGFFAAEDADSIPPTRVGDPSARAVEGAFYLWTLDEVRQTLGPDAEGVIRAFGIRAEGNAPADPHGDFAQGNILFRPALPGSDGETAQVSAHARQLLLVRRSLRPRPSRDDKVVTAWNGLMIAACARASWLLPDTRALSMAQRAASVVEATLWDPVSRRLRRRVRHGNVVGDGGSADYAGMIFGLLELFQADGDPHWLEWATRLQASQDELFLDRAAGGWFETTGEDPSVLLRLKDDYDGAEPSSTALSVLNLLVLEHLLPSGAYQDAMARAFQMFAGRAHRSGRSAPLLLAARSAAEVGLRQVVLAGREDDVTRARFDEVLRRSWTPFTIRLPLMPAHRERLATLLPWTAGMAADDEVTAYVCRRFTCLTPARTVDEFANQLT